MQTQGILRTVGRQLTALFKVTTEELLTRDKRRDVSAQDCKSCHVAHVRHQMLDATTRLQESSNKGTEADHGASGDLEVGSGTSRVLGSASASSGRARARAGGTASTRARGGGVGAVGGSRASARCGLVQDNGGGVVGADNKSAGRVTGAGNGDGVDARGNGRNGGRDANISGLRGLRSDNSGLGGDDRVSGRLAGDGGSSGGLASHNTKGVGLLEESGLGEGVDRGRLGLGESRSGESSDSKGGTHLGFVVGVGVVDLEINDCLRV